MSPVSNILSAVVVYLWAEWMLVTVSHSPKWLADFFISHRALFPGKEKP